MSCRVEWCSCGSRECRTELPYCALDTLLGSVHAARMNCRRHWMVPVVVFGMLTTLAACESDGASPVSTTTASPQTTDVDGTGTEQTSSVTSEPTSVPTTPTTTDAAADITRPYVDPATCASGLRRATAVQDETYFPFAITREAPIPLQVLAEPVDGIAKPYAVIVRLFDSQRDFTVADPVLINGATVNISTFSGGQLMAAWTLPDNSTAYVRSRGLDRDALVALIERLVPRSRTAPIPGFDLSPSAGTDRFGLLHESLNTGLSATWATFQCTTPTSQGIYYVSAVTGDPLLMYFSVLGTPNLRAVGANGDGALIIRGGLPGDPAAPTLAQVEQASVEVWNALPVARQT